MPQRSVDPRSAEATDLFLEPPVGVRGYPNDLLAAPRGAKPNRRSARSTRRQGAPLLGDLWPVRLGSPADINGSAFAPDLA
jgi:hypothetical protein